jgi:hypothetical protein
MLGKVHRRAEERRAVQPVDQAVDHIPGNKLQVANLGEDDGIDEPRAGNG